MSQHIGDFRGGSLEANAILRLPLGADYSGYAGPHPQHDVAPIELAPAWNWLTGATRSTVAWIADMYRRGAHRQGRSVTHRVAPPGDEAAL